MHHSECSAIIPTIGYTIEYSSHDYVTYNATYKVQHAGLSNVQHSIQSATVRTAYHTT